MATAAGAALLFGCSAADSSATTASTGGKLVSLVHAGGVGGAVGRSVSVDAAGNRIVTGSISGSIDLGAGPITGDVFVAKLAPDGHLLWAHGYATQSSACAATLDAAGRVYVAGFVGGAEDTTVDFGNGASHVKATIGSFLVALDADGNYRWSHVVQTVGVGSFFAQGFAADNDGNVWLTGAFEGGLTLGKVNLESQSSDQTVAIARIAPDGSYLGVNVIKCPSCTSQSSLSVDSVAIDPAGNAVVLGSFGGTVDFNGSSMGGFGGSDVFFAKYGPDVAISAKDVFGGPNDDYAGGVAIAPSGVIALSGNFGANARVAGKSLSAADIVVATIDASGNYGWATRIGTNGTGSEVAIDASGAVAVSTECSYLGGGAITAPAGNSTHNACILKLDAAGNAQWGGVIGGPTGSFPQSVAFDPKTGNVVWTGVYSAGADFGSGPMGTSGAGELFLATYTP